MIRRGENILIDVEADVLDQVTYVTVYIISLISHKVNSLCDKVSEDGVRDEIVAWCRLPHAYYVCFACELNEIPWATFEGILVSVLLDFSKKITGLNCGVFGFMHAVRDLT